jgi:hypothetical protein
MVGFELAVVFFRKSPYDIWIPILGIRKKLYYKDSLKANRALDVHHSSIRCNDTRALFGENGLRVLSLPVLCSRRPLGQQPSGV